MKTLIYIGANKGNGLLNYLNDFDKIYAFEPLPEAYQILKQKFDNVSHLKLINAACSVSEGLSDFYLTHKDQCSSFYEIHEEYEDQSLRKFSKKVTVQTINLKNFLYEENVNFIDHYVSDAQGFDFKILSTIPDFVNDKKIKSLFIETHSDVAKIYENADNKFSNFKNLLDKNYNIKFFSFDGVFVSPENLHLYEGISAMEWDTYWELK
jgi:FkbM family methyltransferase